MKYLFLIVYLLPFTLSAQQYAVASISAQLKENAHAVVRRHDTEFTVKNVGEATMKVTGAITVLDEKGESHAILAVPYNKFTKVNDIEAQLYDATGEKVKRLKRADIESYSTNDGSNSIDDSFVKYAVLKHQSYPYTVAFSYEYSTKNMMFYPKWSPYPRRREGVSVEQSSFSVSMPQALQLRYKELLLPSPVNMTNYTDRTLYSWQCKDLKAIENEPFGPDLTDIIPQVFTAPTQFEVEGYQGNLSTWSDLGRFYGQLNQNRYALPEQLKNTIKAKTSAAKTPTEKIKKLYEYLQANTRYVSIQLGIGGWQSMKADEVAAKGYGDCKGLSTYMKAMLQEIGIPSHTALVLAGDDETDIKTDFPSFQFNHLFLCVPLQKDTIWLECTSQNNPFGYLGNFTSDRHVVLITDEGGRLIKTPSYRSGDNRQLRSANIQLFDDGNATAVLATTYSGTQQDEHADAMHNLTSDEQKKWLYQTLNVPSAEITQFDFKETRDKIPYIEEKLTISLRNTTNKTGKRLFLTPNLFNRHQSVPLISTDRKYNLALSQAYQDLDSLTFEIPDHFTVEYLPEPTTIRSDFGKYESSVKQKGNSITYIRRITMEKGIFPAAAYNGWVDFRKKIVKADKNQIVLVAKE